MAKPPAAAGPRASANRSGPRAFDPVNCIRWRGRLDAYSHPSARRRLATRSTQNCDRAHDQHRAIRAWCGWCAQGSCRNFNADAAKPRRTSPDARSARREVRSIAAGQISSGVVIAFFPVEDARVIAAPCAMTSKLALPILRKFARAAIDGLDVIGARQPMDPTLATLAISAKPRRCDSAVCEADRAVVAQHGAHR